MKTVHKTGKVFLYANSIFDVEAVDAVLDEMKEQVEVEYLTHSVNLIYYNLVPISQPCWQYLLLLAIFSIDT